MLRRLPRDTSNSGTKPADPRAAERIIMRRIQTLNGHAMFQCAATVLLIACGWVLDDYRKAVLMIAVGGITRQSERCRA